MIAEGVLHSWFETGTEGQIWVLLSDKLSKPDGHDFYGRLVILDQYVGKKLTIYSPDRAVLWSGQIEPDFDEGWQEYPRNPGNGQPLAYGLWVHWTQKGFKCEEWADFFFTGPDFKYPVRKWDQPLRAKLE